MMKYENTTQDDDLCVAAHKDAVNVETFVGKDWPGDFESIGKFLARSTMFDEEISLNRGNAEVLPSLHKALK